MTTTAALATPTTPTTAEPCDRCTAVAQVRAILPTAGELLFCGYHIRLHAPRLREIGAELTTALS